MAVAEAGRQAKFVEGSLFRHVSVMALTSSVGLMAVFVVDLINMVYIAMLGREELAAAIGYAGAILFFTTSFGIGMSIAVSALVSRALGQRDVVQAREKSTTGLILGFLFGALFAAVVWVFLSPLVSLLGATGETHDLAVWFLQIVTPSQPLLMVGMIGGAILRSHGDARAAMMATVWGALATAVLDPILIFGLGLDLTGAALASVAARVMIAAMALRPIIRNHGGFDRPSPRQVVADMGPVWAIAVPAILTQMATPVGQAFVTRATSAYGEAAVAGMAIAGRLTPVAFGVIFALSGAIGPIIGQNFGAGRLDRVRGTLRDGLIFTALVILFVSALLFVLRAPIADLFHAEGLTRDLVYLFCGPLALLWFFNGMIFVGNAVCNNLGRPFWSTVVNWGRHTVGTIPLALWLGGLWGAPGVLIGQALGGVVFGLLAVWLALRAIADPAAPRGGQRQPAAQPSGPEAEPVASPGERRA
ncbi:MAG: MATE family efflux transporter [Tabrizicola sp.]|uniref:MATE family efflux transporter n=1 Tax=Tabrizicola sp. TaxID=2005166 RepID=UPI002733E0B3|nr:MATE family efflux transporter [Tabrizicola sp.]MDP3261935.1 MATE family efflux transporter [Tabrizicola sp.]MDP3649967.1 MATE family efflux transporter [Paracoccaceae bacterium]MDZ4067176.1 MATE family efflux transporter [Tabrizicola sp.]